MQKIKTIFLAVMTAIFMSLGLNAQTVSNYDSEAKFLDNWSIGLEGGVQTNLYDWNNPQGAVVGLNINKQISPQFGVSAEGYVGFNNTGNWFVPTGHFHNLNVVDNVNVYISGCWNLMNTFASYTGSPRLFEIETNLGVGYGRFFNNSKVADDSNMLLGKAGLNFNFNLGKDKAWTVAVKPAVVWNFTDATRLYGRVADNKTAVFQVTAGVVYHFGTSNGKHHIVASPVEEYTDEIDNLNHQVNNLRAALAEAQAKPTATEVVEREVVVNTISYVNATYVVTFAFDSDELTCADKMVLDAIPADATVNIVAYASPEGSKTYNEQLSVRRGNTVAEYLTNRGVTVNSVKGEGAVDSASNRIAIIMIQ